MRALSEGYRSVLPHGVFPAALLFLEVPLEEVDVNVHPAKTEVRFRRASAVADSVRESVRAALATGGFLRLEDGSDAANAASDLDAATGSELSGLRSDYADERRTRFAGDAQDHGSSDFLRDTASATRFAAHDESRAVRVESAGAQEAIEFGWTPPADESPWLEDRATEDVQPSTSALDAVARNAQPSPPHDAARAREMPGASVPTPSPQTAGAEDSSHATPIALPPLNSAAGLVREAAQESLTPNIRPLGQLEDSFIIATDAEGLLLIDQHVAHERILFDKYSRLEASRQPDSQQLLVPETFDLTPAQAAAFDEVSTELERYGFGLMRLSGRTVAVRAVPADLPAAEARNLLAEILETVDSEKRGRARANLREEIAASLACRAAIKINTPLTEEKMRWLIDRLLVTSSPTTCPHGRPIILRLTKRDIERGFHRP